jgi:8-oxo-dGTP pyrophosphatase MutT (NUDIX family)
MSVIQHVRRQLDAYLRMHPEDEKRLQALIFQIEDDPTSLLSRSCMRGHVTTTGIVLSPDLTCILEVEHRALGRWLPPGGHYEAPGTLFASACREPVEETGVRGLKPFRNGFQIPLDVDTHPIPANPAKGEGAHLHHDFAYLLVAGDTFGLIPQEEEVGGVQWTPIGQYAARGERSSRISERIEDMKA